MINKLNYNYKNIIEPKLLHDYIYRVNGVIFYFINEEIFLLFFILLMKKKKKKFFYYYYFKA